MRNNEFKNADFINDEKTFHWIPIEEALPEEDKNVLLTFLAYPDYKEPTVDSEFAYLHNNEWYWSEEDENDCRQKIKVPILAWMAIEPYKKEENNSKNINSKEEKEMKILLKEDVKANLDEKGWSAYENEKDIDFSTCTAFGGDIDIVIDKGENLIDLAHNIYEYWNNYDVSYETSLWIGEDGHGINGAPYDLKDIYEDMEGVKNMIEELYNIINEDAEEKKKSMSKYTIKDNLFELRTTLEKAKQRLTELKKEVGVPIGASKVVTEDDLLVDDIKNHLEILEDYAEMSQEYCEFLEGLNQFSITDFKRIVKTEDLSPLRKFLSEMTTDKHCPKCDETLFKSDLPYYEYTCCNCDENFYECEVK